MGFTKESASIAARKMRAKDTQAVDGHTQKLANVWPFLPEMKRAEILARLPLNGDSTEGGS